MICGKVAYSRVEAMAVIKGMNKAKKRKGRIHYCTDCDAWHTTSRLTQSKMKKRKNSVSKQLGIIEKKYKNDARLNQNFKIKNHNK